MPDGTLSFARDIRPMFTEMDVDHMAFAMNLNDGAEVLLHADAIYKAVSNGSMPPGKPWTAQMCETFKTWKEQGGQP